MENEIQVNDFVWAKMVGSPTWPSLIVEPGSNVPLKPSLVKMHWVYFFGTHNYAWIEEQCIKPYEEFKEKFTSLCRTSSFKSAVAEVEDVLEKQKNDPSILETYIKKFKQPRTPLKRTKPMANTGSNTKRKIPAKVKDHHSSDSSETEYEYYNTIEDSATSTITLNFSPDPDNVPFSRIPVSGKHFGVLGIGILGRRIVENLVKSGHKVNIWNRTFLKCEELEEYLHNSKLLKSFNSPRHVLERSDIVFNCVSDHDISINIIQVYFGVNEVDDDILNGKGFVELTGSNPETSQDLKDMIEAKGGRYLEAQVQFSKVDERTLVQKLVFFTAGSNSLFLDCQSCFASMATTSVFFGSVGYGSKFHLVMQLIKGVSLVGMAEAMALAERFNLKWSSFLQAFFDTDLACEFLKDKASRIVQKDFINGKMSLLNMKKDLKNGLELSEKLNQPMVISSLAHQIFNHCCRLDYGNNDVSVVFMRRRH